MCIGLFHIPSYTLHSDEISFTGNALGSTQKADAICRIVSNTETKEMITKFALGSLISSKRNFLIPLDTQDRFYRDIYLSYSPTSKIEFFAHPDKGWTSLDSGLPFLQSFITRELWTEEQ